MRRPITYEAFVNVLGRDWGDSAIEEIVAKLPDSELERIEQLAFYDSTSEGVSLAFKDKTFLSSGGKEYLDQGPVTLIAVHLYAEGYEDHQAFQGGLVNGLKFDDDRVSVRRKMGHPWTSGGGNQALGRVWPYWDRFDVSSHHLRVQYRGDGEAIDILTLMVPSEAAS